MDSMISKIERTKKMVQKRLRACAIKESERRECQLRREVNKREREIEREVLNCIEKLFRRLAAGEDEPVPAVLVKVDRNKGLRVPYTVLLPSKMPAGITI